MTNKSSKLLLLKQFAGGVLVLLLVLFSLNCGGGGGGSEPAASVSVEQGQQKTEAKIQIDLADFSILENQQKARLAGKDLSDIQQVTISVTVGEETLLKDVELRHISGTLYEVTLQDLPIGEQLTLEIEAKDSQGEVILRTMSETTLESSSAQENAPEIAIPLSAVIEFDGQILDKEQVNNLVAQVSSAESDEEAAEIFLLSNDEFGNFIKNFTFSYKAYLKEAELVIRKPNDSAPLVKILPTEYGRPGQMTNLSNPIAAATADQITYGYPGIEAWYKRADNALEQGFTLAEAPNGTGDVCVDFLIEADNVIFRGDSFLFETGDEVFRYDKLLVFDATGKTLDSKFEYSYGDTIRICFNDENAVYPVVIDPAITASQVQLRDNNNDGRITQVRVLYDEDITSGNTNTTGWSVQYNGANIGIHSVLGVGSFINVFLDTFDTDLVIDTRGDGFEIAYDANSGNLAFASGNFADNINFGDTGVEDSEDDVASPVLVDVEFSTQIAPAGMDMAGNILNTIELTYSENMVLSLSGTSVSEVTNNGSFEYSTGTLGSMTTARTLEGFISWNAGGGGTMSGNGNNVNGIVLSDNVVTVYLNASNEGYFASGTSGPTATTVTVIADANDVKGIDGRAVSTAFDPTEIFTNAWDVTGPSIVDVINLDTNNDGMTDTLEFQLSDNIIDAFTRAELIELDGDSVDNGSGESFGLTVDTSVSTLAVDTDGSDEYISVTFSNLTGRGTGNMYYRSTDAMFKDAAGNVPDFSGTLGPTRDTVSPVLISVDFTQLTAPTNDVSGNLVNAIDLVYSENIHLYSDGAGGGEVATDTTANTTTNLGAMTTARTLAGLIQWGAGSGGDMETSSDITGTVQNISGNQVRVFLNTAIGGYFSNGSSAPTSPTITVISNTNFVEDYQGQALNAAGPAVTVNNTITWDVTAPTVSTLSGLDQDANGSMETVQITFSDNMIDESLVATMFEFDSDSTNDSTGETLGATGATDFLSPIDADEHDENYRVNPATELSGTGNYYLHILTQGGRDRAGNRLAVADDVGTWVDTLGPGLLSVDFSRGVAPSGSEVSGNLVNMITLAFSEEVHIYQDGSGGSEITTGSAGNSTSTLGSMATANLIAGIFRWDSASGGDMTGSDTANHIVKSSANTLTVYLNGALASYFLSGSSGPATPGSNIISDANDLTDINGNPGNTGIAPVVTNSGSWDTAAPTVVSVYSLDTNNDGNIDTVDVIFSENIIDGSVTPASIELDLDQYNNGVSETTSNAASTQVTQPTTDNDAQDDKISLTLTAALMGSTNVFLHHNTLGLRDESGNPLALGDALGNAIDAARPVIQVIDITQSVAPTGTDLSGNILNAVQLSYSENLLVYTDGAGGGQIAIGNHAESTADMGSMATANLLEGLLSWTGGVSGDIRNSADDNNRVELVDGNVINVYFNSQNTASYHPSSTTAPGAPAPTPSAVTDSSDLTDHAGLLPMISSAIVFTISNSWDITPPTVYDVYSLDTNYDGDIDSVDITFSENVLDNSINVAHYEIDDDSNNNGSGEINPNSVNTAVAAPSSVNAEHDEYINFGVATPISGSENVFLHVITQGTRDIYGNLLATVDAAGNAIDQAPPVLMVVDFTALAAPTGTEVGGNTVNAITLGYSENVQVYTDGAGGGAIGVSALSQSTSTQGSMTSANLLTGLISWSGGQSGDMMGNFDTANAVQHATGNTVNVYLNASFNGHFSSGSAAPTTPSVNVIADTSDLVDEAGLAAYLHSTPVVNNSSAWDVTAPDIDQIYALDTNANGMIDLVTVMFTNMHDVIDGSFTLANFELDDDATNNAIGEVTPNAFSTIFSYPAGDTDSDDNKISFTLSPEVPGSDEVYLHNLQLGARDHAGNPLSAGNNLATTNTDAAQPILISANFTQLTAPSGTDLTGNTLNAIQLAYSENIQLHTNGMGGADITNGSGLASTNTLGSMTQANLVTGLISWSGAQSGDLTSSDHTVNYVELSSGNIVNVYFNTSNSGYFNTGSTGPDVPTVVAIQDVNDLEDAVGFSVNIQNTVTVTNPIDWDDTSPTVVDNYSLDRDADGNLDSFDVVFSDNILDASVVVGNFAFDDDATNPSGNEKTVTSGNTNVSKPSVANVGNDEYYHFELTNGNELVGSDAGFLHHNTLGLRDIAGMRLALGDGLGNEIDCAGPVLLNVGFTSAASPGTSEMGGNTVNVITLGYSENIIISNNNDGGDDIAVGAISSSSNTMGGMTTARDLAGLFTWNALDGGDMVNNADIDNVVEHTSGNEITVYLNANYNGYFVSGTSSPSTNATISSIYSDNLDVRDSSFVAVNPLSSPTVTVTAATNSTAWDVTKPQASSINPTTGPDLSTFDLRTPDITYSESVTFGTNTELYTVSLNGAFQLGATDAFLTIDTMTETSANVFEMVFNETTDRFKSGSFQIDISEIIRDDAGNRLDPSADQFTYTVEVENVALFEFETSDTTDNFNSWTSDDFDPLLSGGSSGNLTTTGWGIDGNAMNLYGTENFTINGLDYHGFPQNKGAVSFWYWVPNTPSVNDIVFGDLNTTGGNALTIRYTGSDNTYRVTAHGVAAGNTLDFNMYLGSYNHISLKYNHDNNLRVDLNGQRLSNLITTGEWFPDDQDVIWQPNGTIDHVWISDIVRNEANTQSYFIPLTEAEYTFNSGNVTGANVEDEENDFLGTIYGSANVVEGHHGQGNSIHLHTSLMGFRPEDHGKHLFPHIQTGTLQFWVNPDPVDGVNINLLDEPDSGRDHFYFRGTGNRAEYQFIIQTSAGGGTLGSSTIQLQDQAWNHIGVTWDTSDNLLLYVNGSANYTYNMPGGWSLGGQIIGTTPRGYLDDITVTDNIWSASDFQTHFDNYHVQTASYSFDEGATAANINTPWLNTNDIGIYYTTDTSGNHHRMFFHGVAIPTLDRPHYGDLTTTGNSIALSGNSGFSVYSMESDFFPSQDGTYIWWWKPSYETGGNTVEVLDTEDLTRDHFMIESIDSSGNYQFGLRDTTGTISDNHIFRPVMERWNHMSITWTSNSSDHGNNPWASFYLNGVEVWDVNIGSWRPTGQKTASTPYGSLDNFRIRSYPYTSAQVLDEYDDYIINTEEFLSTNSIVMGFADNDFEATMSHDSDLMHDVDVSNMKPTIPVHGRYNQIRQSTTGHHGFYDDLDRTNTPDGGNTGAQEFLGGGAIWAPVLDKGRFPQDEGTLRFWYKPVWEYGDEDVVFGGNFIDANNHNNFFVIEETATQGFYDFNIYEDGVLLGGLTNFEMHRNIFNYVAVTWRAGDEVDLYINGSPRDATTMGTWRPSDQIFVSTPNGVLDMLFLEDEQRDEDFINDYFITYVTAKGFYTFEGDILPDVVDQSGSLQDATVYNAGVIQAAQGFDVSSSEYLDLTPAGSYLDIPGLIKDLFPQEEGVVRFWYDPAVSSDNNTYVYDSPDLTRNHFYITSQSQEGYYRFAIQSDMSSDNLGGYYDFYLDLDDWNLLSFNWSADDDKINFMVNGKVMYTTNMGNWRPSKQISVSTPNGFLDDVYISYEYESIDEIEAYFHSYKTVGIAGSFQSWGDGALGQLGNNETVIVDTPQINTNKIRISTSAGGTDFGVAILENTKVISWGSNNRGQLGIGSTTTKLTPEEIDLWNGFEDIDAGDTFVLGTLVNGNLIGWGDNSRNQLGFTSGGTAYENEPRIFDNITGITGVSCGNSHALAIDTVGNVYAWGANDYGQCGQNPATATVTTPTQIIAGGGSPSPIKVACGYAHSLVLFDDGSITAYGLNGNGQLGNGTTTDSSTGVSAGISGTAIDIACGDDFSLALLNTNVVETWGKNDNGQLGNNDSNLFSSSTPVRVKNSSGSDLSSVSSITAGSVTSYALLSDGSVHTWGGGISGELGNGSRSVSQEYSANIIGVDSLAYLGKAGSGHITPIISRSEFYDKAETIDVILNFDEVDFSDIGGYHFNGQHYGSPTSGNGRSNKGLSYLFEDEEYFGISDLGGNVFPQDEGTISFWYQATASTPTGANIFDEPDLTRDHFHMQHTGGGNIDVVQTNGGLASTLGTFSVNLNEWHFLALTWQTNSSMYTIANNDSATTSFVGFGSWTPSEQLVISTPVGHFDNLNISSEFSSVSELMDDYTFGANGSTGEYVKAWGANSLGELGDGTTTNQFGPVDVTSIDNPLSISVGTGFKIALYPDGTMQGIGENSKGQLGDGSNSDRSSAVDVSNGHGFVSKIESGLDFTVGLLSNGNVIAWGNNAKGQIGVNSSIQYFVDARLIPNLPNIQDISVGYGHVLALDTSGNLHVWGNNGDGQLGVGTASSFETSPRQVVISDVAEISAGAYHSMARTTAGLLYVWGKNNDGQVGNGNTADQYLPVLLTSVLNVTDIYAGNEFNVVLDTSNQLWIWGDARNNSLNITPTVLTTNANIDDIAIGADHFIVLLNNNTLMAWGDNTYGQLGLDDNSVGSVSVLTAIPNLSSILNVSVVKDSNFVVGQ